MKETTKVFVSRWQLLVVAARIVGWGGCSIAKDVWSERGGNERRVFSTMRDSFLIKTIVLIMDWLNIAEDGMVSMKRGVGDGTSALILEILERSEGSRDWSRGVGRRRGGRLEI